MRIVPLILIALVVLSFGTGCLGGGGKGVSSTGASPTSSQPISASSSGQVVSHSAPHSTHTTPSFSETGTKPSGTTASSPRPYSIEVSSYTANISTVLNFSTEVTSGGVTRIQNVSILTSSSGYFDLNNGGMAINMTVRTYPEGARYVTRALLIGGDAYLFSDGRWLHLRKGDKGYEGILDLYRYNPLSIFIEEINAGRCRASGGGSELRISCRPDGEDLRGLVSLLVGSPNGSKISVSSPLMELRIRGGTPVNGTISLLFEVSYGYTDPYGGRGKVVERGLLLRRFNVLSVNRTVGVLPPG
ncbi:hypothetical protein [Thermococcus sp.]